MKLVLALMYVIYIEDWDMDCINKITQAYNRVSKVFVLWLQYLQGKELEEIQ